jgi:hypothetical protein
VCARGGGVRIAWLESGICVAGYVHGRGRVPRQECVRMRLDNVMVVIAGV